MNPSQLDGCVGINVDDSESPANSQAFHEACAAKPFVPVSGLSVCHLSPNRVLVVGGRCRNGLVQRFNVIRLLDFERDYGRFDFRKPSRIDIRTSVPLAREAQTLTPDAAAKLYVLIGGFRKVDADALSLSPAKAAGGLKLGKRARCSDAPARAAAPAGTVSDSMWALRPLGDSDFKWETIGSLGKKRTQSCLGPRFGHVAVCREEKSRRASSCVSSIFVHGGYDSVDAQSPRPEVHKLTVSKGKGGLSSTWEAVAMPRKRKGVKHVAPPARAFHAAALLENRFLAVHGGVNGPCTGLTPGTSPSTFCDDLYVLDLEKRVWCVPSDAESDNSSHRPSPRAFHSAVHGFGADAGSVIFFGGQVIGKGCQPSAEVFRMTLHLPESEGNGSPSVTWAKRDIGPDYALARAGLVSFPDAGKYVVVGGVEKSGDTMTGLFGFEPFQIMEETVRDGTMQPAAMDASGEPVQRAPPPSFPHPQPPSATLTPQRSPKSERIVAGLSIKEESLVAPATRSYLQEEQGSSTLEKSLQNEPDEGTKTPRVTPGASEGVALSGGACRGDIERKVNSPTRDACDESGGNRSMPSGLHGSASGEVDGPNGVDELKSVGDGLEGKPAISVEAVRDVSSPGDIHVANVDTARPIAVAGISGGALPANEIEPIGKRCDEEVDVSREVHVSTRSVCFPRTLGEISSEQSAAAAKEGPKGVDNTTPADPSKRDAPTLTGSGSVDCRHDSRNVESILGDGHVDDDGDESDVMNLVETEELPKASPGKCCTDPEDGLPPAKRARLVESVLDDIRQSPHVDDDHDCDRGEPRGVVLPDSIGQDSATDAGERGSEPLPAETPPSGVPFVSSGPRTSIGGSPYVTAEEYCAMAGVLQPVRGRGRGRSRGRPRGRGRGRGAVGGRGRDNRGQNLGSILSHGESGDDADPEHIKRGMEDNIDLRSKITRMQRDLEATDKALREKTSIIDSKNQELRELTAERNVLIHQKNKLVMDKRGPTEAILREELENDLKAELEKEWKARFDDEVAMRRKAEQQVHEHEQFINGLADEQADREIAECPECERNAMKLENTKEECRQARMLAVESNKELANAAEHVRKAESRCEQLDAEKRQIQARLEDKVQQLSELDNARLEITRFRKTISHQKRELEVMEGKCTEWKSRVTAAETQVAEMRSSSTAAEAATRPSAQCNRKDCLRARTTLQAEQEKLGERAKQLAISRGELVTMTENVTRLERDLDRVSRSLAEAERRAEIACEKRDALSSEKDSVSDHLLRVKTEYALLSERSRALVLGLGLDSLIVLVGNVQKSLGSSGEMQKANGGDGQMRGAANCPLPETTDDGKTVGGGTTLCKLTGEAVATTKPVSAAVAQRPPSREASDGIVLSAGKSEGGSVEAARPGAVAVATVAPLTEKRREGVQRIDLGAQKMALNAVDAAEKAAGNRVDTTTINMDESDGDDDHHRDAPSP